MRNKKNPWILIIFLLSGALIGGIAGELISQYQSFSWVSLGGSSGYKELMAVSFNPLIDTHTIRFGFDFVLRINAGSLLGMILGIIIFTRV